MKSYSLQNFFANVSFVLYAVYALLPIYGLIHPTYRYILIFLCVVFFYSAVLLSGNKLSTEVIKVTITIFFLDILIFWVFYRNFAGFTVIFNLFMYFLAIPMSLYYSKCVISKKDLKRLIVIILLIYGITVLTSIVGLMIYPEASRYLSSTRQASIMYKYQIMNIAGFAFVSTIPVILIIILYLLKYGRGLNKLFYMLIFIISLFLLIYAQYGIGIISGLIAIFLFLMYAKNKPTNNYKILLWMCIAFVIILICRVTNILDAFSKTLDKGGFPTISIKFQELHLWLHYGVVGTSLGARFNVYLKSLMCFIQYPIFGSMLFRNSEDLVGGHSTCLDLFARAGIFYSATIFGLFIYCIKKVFGNFSTQRGLIKSVLTLLFVISILNPVILSYPLTFMVFIFTTLVIKYKDF